MARILIEIDGTRDNDGAIIAAARAAAEHLGSAKSPRRVSDVHVHHAVKNESDEPEEYRTAEQHENAPDEPTDVSTLQEAPAEIPTTVLEHDLIPDSPAPHDDAEAPTGRKRRNKEEKARGDALVAQGYKEKDVIEYQLRGVPLPPLPGEASDDGEPETVLASVGAVHGAQTGQVVQTPAEPTHQAPAAPQAPTEVHVPQEPPHRPNQPQEPVQTPEQPTQAAPAPQAPPQAPAQPAAPASPPAVEPGWAPPWS